MSAAGESGAPIQFSKSVQRSMALMLMLSCLGHKFHPCAQREGMTVFSDAAECRHGRFRVGLVGYEGPYKSYLCPKGVTSLQQAELWGIYIAAKIAIYIAENSKRRGAAGHRVMRIGTDSEASRYQVIHGHAATPLVAHQRILRRLFWLRTWSRVTIGIFRVASHANPADPLSRLRSFSCKQEAKAEADRRMRIWESCASPFQFMAHLPPPHWKQG